MKSKRPNRLRRASSSLTLVIFAGAVLTLVLRPQPKMDSALSHDTLPVYSKPDLRPRWDEDAMQGRIGTIRLRDQDNAALDEHIFDSGPTVVSFFFTGCATVCPVAMELLNEMRRTLGAEAPAFLSISVTPLADTPQTLNAYATQLGLDKQWKLTTGIPAEVYRMARISLFSDIETPGPDGSPPHTERAFLIDRQHRIRGIYNANRSTELMRLRHDLDVLHLEQGSNAERPNTAT
jgi:protein SCO1/2